MVVRAGIHHVESWGERIWNRTARKERPLPMPYDTWAQLAARTAHLRDVLFEELSPPASCPHWRRLAEQFSLQTGSDDRRAFADAVAQAVTCGCFGWGVFPTAEVTPRARQWLLTQADPLLQSVLQLAAPGTARGSHSRVVVAAAQDIAQCVRRERSGLPAHDGSAASRLSGTAVYFYEQFLHAYDCAARRRQGVFYTPQPLVSFVVRSVDELLRDEFHLDAGIADGGTWQDVQRRSQAASQTILPHAGRPFVKVLDPAMGTGAFLLETVSLMYQRFLAGTRVEASGQRAVAAEQWAEQWNEYVAGHLLQQVWGQELMLPALVIAQLSMTALLAETGYRFEQPGQLHLYLANTLRQPQVGPAAQLQSADSPFTVILGNPPFSGVSDNRHAWMRQLLRGCAPGTDQSVANYFLAEGQPLGERKHWLEDDYVKFMRFAHWKIEVAGAGMVALITNHGFLDNATFRGMREQLIGTFPRMTLVDLHGNKRNGEGGPDGRQDDSVFDIGQGVAVSLLRRGVLGGPHESRIRHADLWGTRRDKLGRLAHQVASSLELATVRPQAPYFFLVPKNADHRADYRLGHRLDTVMPVHSTAAVTARDGLVIAFDETELRERMELLRNLQVPDETIRTRFFGSRRSHKYLAGDTRGWSLSAARQRLHDDPDWDRHIRPCLYRPFDRRAIYWTPWMIDWPRSNVMNQLAGDDNLAIVARRQTPPALPCNYFWVTDTIAIDGLIRSDNRGSESVFPLFLPSASLPDAPAEVWGHVPASSAATASRPNLRDEYIRYCEERLGLRWDWPSTGVGDDTFGPRDLFFHAYALFHARSFRERFADALRVDFPRLFIPRDPRLFRALAGWGAKLVDVHLLRHRDAGNAGGAETTEQQASLLAPGHPKYHEASIWLNAEAKVGPVSRAIWDYRVGTYQVCRKWLKDRRGRRLLPCEQQRYRRIVAAIGETLEAAMAIDQAIAQQGGWETAF